MKKVTAVSFNQHASDLLDELKDKYGLKTKAEVLRRAIALLSLAMQADRENAKLVIRGESRSGEQYEKQIII